MSVKRPAAGVQVLHKTIDSLDALRGAPDGMSLAGLAAQSGMPKPTVYRILQSLRTLGYVEPAGPQGSYLLSERLASLMQNDRYVGAREQALPLMRRLHRTFNETVNLGLLEGVFVNDLHVLETTQPLRWIVKPGARDPFHTTALGRAIVSQLPASRQETILRKAVPRAHTLRVKMQAALATAQSRGWAIDHEESATGVVCVALPLQGWGEPLAALSVSVPANRFSPERLDRIVAEFGQLPRPLCSAAGRRAASR